VQNEFRCLESWHSAFFTLHSPFKRWAEADRSSSNNKEGWLAEVLSTRSAALPIPKILTVGVDTTIAPEENADMQVTLTKDLEEFIARKVETGGYADASEVIRDALRNFRAKNDPAEMDSQELADLLLPAVRGRHRPLTSKHFAQLRLRARRKPART
jgi:putative addiction module CopG family antidote